VHPRSSQEHQKTPAKTPQPLWSLRTIGKHIKQQQEEQIKNSRRSRSTAKEKQASKHKRRSKTAIDQATIVTPHHLDHSNR